jgi:alkylated DNA nucleotide flippase Atl1
MKAEKELSKEYHQVKAILLGGWKGTYGDLAECIGRSRRSGRIIGRLVKSFALRYPNWCHDNVTFKNQRIEISLPPLEEFIDEDTEITSDTPNS